MSPQRIQRQRTKGWRMPDNAVYVGRPSQWKNPYKITRSESGAPIVVTVDKWGIEQGARWAGFDDKRQAAVFAVDLYRRMLLGALDRDPHFREHYLDELAGKDLACWCPLNQPCHADVLLRIANGGSA